MVCEWCGVVSAQGNHGAVTECVAALEQEVESLRAAVAQRQRFLERMQRRPAVTEREAWRRRKVD